MAFQLRGLQRLLPIVAIGIAACTSTGPKTTNSDNNPASDARVTLTEPQPDTPLWTAVPRPIAYTELPGWDSASLTPGFAALKRSCRRFAAVDSTRLLSQRAPWAGRYGDWQAACAALELVSDEASGRAVFEAMFRPVEVQSPGADARFTGYFEPTINVRARPSGEYTEPIPAVPSDLVERNGKVYQRGRNGRLKPYPSRKDITRRGVDALAYAHPADVFFLQIQGSGRMVFPDGSVMRAAYGANNGRPFRSTANWLMRKGWISRADADMTGIKAWMSTTSSRRMRQAMNANPRFVFFNAERIEEPGLGPKGSFGVPLTPLGSLAVDPAYHAAGIPMFVETNAPGLNGTWRGLVAAQDTGGAIKGAIRGDLYFGTGPQAGQAAETLNTSGRLWVLLPRKLAAQLDVAS